MLNKLLSWDEPVTGFFDWHERVSAGLPPAAIQATAEALGVSAADVCGLLKVSPSVLKPRSAKAEAEPLEPFASDYLYRIARAMTRLMAPLSKDPQACAQWLRTAQPSLRLHIPILLLSTTHGADAVFTAISRLPLPAPKDRAPEHTPVEPADAAHEEDD